MYIFFLNFQINLPKYSSNSTNIRYINNLTNLDYGTETNFFIKSYGLDKTDSVSNTITRLSKIFIDLKKATLVAISDFLFCFFLIFQLFKYDKSVIEKLYAKS
jgi:hypothetical protein